MIVAYWYEVGDHTMFERQDLLKTQWAMFGKTKWPVMFKVLLEMPAGDTEQTRSSRGPKSWTWPRCVREWLGRHRPKMAVSGTVEPGWQNAMKSLSKTIGRPQRPDSPAVRNPRRRAVRAAGSGSDPAGFWKSFVQSARRRGRNYLKPRVWLMALVHLAVFALVYWMAFLLRFDFAIPAGDMKVFWGTLPWVLGIKFLVFLIAGQYDGWWTYVTFGDLIALVRYSVAATFFIAAGQYFLGLGFYIPRYVIVMDCLGGIAVLGALRGAWRLYREQFWPILNPNDFRWALLVGTDHATGLLANQIQTCRELPYRVRGLLAMEDGAVGSRLGQIPILGRLEDVREVAAACAASTVLVTAGTLAGSRLRNLMDACKQSGLELKIIRPIQDRLGGDHRIPIRDIEISDLFRRAPVQLDMNIIGRLIEGRTVMVTGAGGSIGSEICRQLAPLQSPHAACSSGGARTASSKSNASCGRSTPAPRCNRALPTSRTRPACGSFSRSSARRLSSTRPRTSMFP